MAKQNTYGMVTKGWSVKLSGPKPTVEQVLQAHALCGLNRAFGKQALARALELREGGATDGQIKAACIAVWGGSGSHHNKRGDLHRAKLVTVDKVKVADDAGGAGHTVYRIALTAKGSALVQGVAPEAKPVKARRVKPVKVDDIPELTAPEPGFTIDGGQIPLSS